jgi:methionyl-tRNA formyltransferase
MKIIFIGTVKFSESALLRLISLNVNIIGVCTLKKSGYNSDYVDLTKICNDNDINIHYMKNVNDDITKKWIKKQKPDIIFCLGLSQIIGKEVLSIPPGGVIGYHPALLPVNRGRHPLIWAIVLGLKETGSTFFYMDEGADSGDIISQKTIKINNSDTAQVLYKKIILAALLQIEKFYPDIVSGKIIRVKQNHKKANYWRKRKFKDGLIDWRMPSRNIYNLVRALNKPYPGAHFTYNDIYVTVWNCEVIKNENKNIEPGQVLSSSREGIIIKSGDHSIMLKKINPLIDVEPGEYL